MALEPVAVVQSLVVAAGVVRDTGVAVTAVTAHTHGCNGDDQLHRR